MLDTPSDLEVPNSPILTFEEFVAPYPGEPIPRYDNFPLHFQNIDPDSTYRSPPYYQRFVEEYPMLEQTLTKVFTECRLNRGSKSAVANQYSREMYEAYKILRSYGATDSQLFD